MVGGGIPLGCCLWLWGCRGQEKEGVTRAKTRSPRVGTGGLRLQEGVASSPLGACVAVESSPRALRSPTCSFRLA